MNSRFSHKTSEAVFFKNPQKGGAALEYIIISVFGLVLAAASVTLVGSLAKEQLTSYGESLGIEISLPDFGLSDDSTP